MLTFPKEPESTVSTGLTSLPCCTIHPGHPLHRRPSAREDTGKGLSVFNTFLTFLEPFFLHQFFAYHRKPDVQPLIGVLRVVVVISYYGYWLQCNALARPNSAIVTFGCTYLGSNRILYASLPTSWIVLI